MRRVAGKDGVGIAAAELPAGVEVEDEDDTAMVLEYIVESRSQNQDEQRVDSEKQIVEKAEDNPERALAMVPAARIARKGTR